MIATVAAILYALHLRMEVARLRAALDYYRNMVKQLVGDE